VLTIMYASLWRSGIIAAIIGLVMSLTAMSAAADEPEGTAFGHPCGMVALIAVPGSNETTEGVGFDIAKKTMGDVNRRIEESKDASIRVHYISYPAQILPNYLDSKNKGYQATWNTLDYYAKQCPTTRFILMGYSQGAHIAGDLAAEIGNHHTPVDPARIRSVRLLADPARNAGYTPLVGMETDNTPGIAIQLGAGRAFGELNGHVTEYCMTSDAVCHNSFGAAGELIASRFSGPHTKYGRTNVSGTNQTFVDRMTDDLIQDVVNLNEVTF
jgi:Cutinase